MSSPPFAFGQSAFGVGAFGSSVTPNISSIYPIKINTGLYPMDTTGDRFWTAFTKTNANFADLATQVAGFTPAVIPIGNKDQGKGIKIDLAFDIINANFLQLFTLVAGGAPLTIDSDPPYPAVIGPGDPAAFLKINVNFTYIYAFHPFPGNYLITENGAVFWTETGALLIYA